MRKWTLLMALAVAAFADKRVVIDIAGMDCPLCTVAIKKSIKKRPGVKKVKVRLNTHRATVVVEDDVKEAALLGAVKEAGYKGVVVSVTELKE